MHENHHFFVNHETLHIKVCHSKYKALHEMDPTVLSKPWRWPRLCQGYVKVMSRSCIFLNAPIRQIAEIHSLNNLYSKYYIYTYIYIQLMSL